MRDLNYTPQDWYWLAQDGRLYSSSRAILIEENDPDYAEWLHIYEAPTPWPCDDEGNQSDDALIDVLQPYGLGESLAPSKDRLLAYAAQKRWQVETGGIALDAISIATDDRSKMMIMGARIKATDDPDFSTQWKVGDKFVVLDGPTIISISNAVLAHVDTCFSVESSVIAMIDAEEITTIEEINAADWPS